MRVGRGRSRSRAGGAQSATVGTEGRRARPVALAKASRDSSEGELDHIKAFRRHILCNERLHGGASLLGERLGAEGICAGDFQMGEYPLLGQRDARKIHVALIAGTLGDQTPALILRTTGGLP